MRDTVNRRGKLTQEERKACSDFVSTIKGVTEKDKDEAASWRFAVSIKVLRRAIDGEEIEAVKLRYIRINLKP